MQRQGRIHLAHKLIIDKTKKEGFFLLHLFSEKKNNIGFHLWFTIILRFKATFKLCSSKFTILLNLKNHMFYDIIIILIFLNLLQTSSFILKKRRKTLWRLWKSFFNQGALSKQQSCNSKSLLKWSLWAMNLKKSTHFPFRKKKWKQLLFWSIRKRIQRKKKKRHHEVQKLPGILKFRNARELFLF